MERTFLAAENITTETIRNFTENSTRLVAQNTSSSDTILPPLWFSYVIFAVSCLLIPLGLLGNITTLVVLKKSRTLSIAPRLTLMALAVSDAASLVTWALHQSFLQQLFSVNIIAATITGCRLFLAVLRMASTCSSLFVVLICIERFTVVWYPLKSELLLTKTAAVASISSVIGTAIILAVPASIYANIENGVCAPYQKFKTPLQRIFDYTSIAAYSIIPALVLLSLTPLIIIKLYKQQSIRRRLSKQSKNKIPRHTIMLVGVVISYICLIAAGAAMFQGLMLSGFNMFSNELWVMIFRTVVATLTQINYSTNFILYSAFSADFRRQLRLLLHCKNPVDFTVKDQTSGRPST